MKRYVTTEFTVGTFALLGLLVIIYMSLEVNDRGTVGGSTKTYHAYFESVSGLVRRVPVEVSGIAAGYVESIDLVDNRARVTVKLREDVKVYADSALTVRDRGILGDRFLMLNTGTPDQPLLGNGDEIKKTFSQSDFEKMTAALSETSETIKELVKSDNPKGALGQVIVNLRDMSQRLNNMVGDNEGRIGRILENMETFSKDLNDITGENKEQIHTVLLALEDVAQTMRDALGKDGSVGKATENFNKTMASLQRITEKIERGEGSIGKLVNDETTVDNINTAVEGVNETLGVFRKIQLGIRYRGEFLSSVRELQNLVAITLAPSPDKYLVFEIVDAPVGKTNVVNTVVSSGGNVVSTTQTIQTDNEMLFTFMFAKRFWDATLRFGLLRSEGGVGMDYHLMKDRVVLSFEAFDFSRTGDRVHLRGYGTLIFYKHFLLTGGVDDMAAKSAPINPFFGVGIQFTDNDLKALLLGLPLTKF